MLSEKIYLCILLPLMRAERHIHLLEDIGGKWLHKWNSSEPVFGITQRGARVYVVFTQCLSFSSALKVAVTSKTV